MREQASRDLPPSAVVEGGEDSYWTAGDKYGFATLADHDRNNPTPIWFTLTEGALTEIRYPRIDLMNVRTVEFVVADPDDEYAVRTYRQYRDGEPEVARETEQTSEDALLYSQRLTPTAADRDWTLTVDYAIHPDVDAVLLDVEFEAGDGQEYDVYAMTELMLSNCGRHDVANRRSDDDSVALTGYHTGDTWDDPVILERTEVDADAAGSASIAGDEPIGSEDVTSVGLADEDDADEETAETTRYEEEPYRVAAALTSRQGFSWGSVDINGGKVFTSLLGDGTPDRTYERAKDETVLFGRLGEGVQSLSDTVALGLALGDGDESAGGTNTGEQAFPPETEDRGEFLALEAAEAALEDDFATVAARFERTWETYLESIDLPESVRESDELAAQYKTAAMTVKAADSKAYPGAGIASPSVPWGDKVQADEPADYGYSYVWGRDLYQTFTAFEAMGDVESAIDATEYVYEYQQRETGFLPQNTFVDGRTRWGGEQMDEIAFPAVMAQQLNARHGYGFEQAGYDYDDVARSAAYVAANGPRSQQERWEEEGGYSPSTTAAEIAGLVAAADLAVEAGERADALTFLGMADHWADHVEDWMATETGAGGHTNTPYYIRISDEGEPDTHTMRTHNNGGGTYDEREVIDGGFLELVRLGVKAPDDPVIRNSVREYDDTIMVETPNGPGWYRYSGDGYGEKDGSEWFRAGVPWATDMRGEGRLWPIFTGERGEYELLLSDEDRDFEPEELLATLQRFANDGRTMPEQVWDRDDDNAFDWSFGEGTSAATPLCWTNAQYIRLAHSVAASEPIEMPAVVRDRYVAGQRASRPSLTAEIPGTATDGTVTVSGRTDAAEVVVRTRETAVRSDVTRGRFSVDVPVAGEQRVIVAAATDDDPFEAGIAVAYDTVEYEPDPTAGTAGVALKDDPSVTEETSAGETDDEGSAST